MDKADQSTTEPRNRVSAAVLDQLFLKARTRNAWAQKPISDELVRELYEVSKWGPTAANTTPARFVFLRTKAAKERLKPHLIGANVDKTMVAPCCVIVAYDSRFFDLMGKLFPSRDMRTAFVGNAPLIEETARRNSTLQGAYMMLAARSLGLDCGPMSGFNPASLDAEFFPDGRWKSNFLFNVGYGTDENLFPRNPRLDFDEACLDL